MRIKTSETHPLRVDFVEGAGLAGRIGLTLAPGKKCSSLYGGYWDRYLDTDLTLLVEGYRVDVLVPLLESHEFTALKIRDLPERARALGMDVRLFPIADVNVPSESSRPAFRELVEGLVGALRADKTVVVHCRGGLGRAGLTAACVLVHSGVAPDEAIPLVRTCRPGAIETPQQEQFVHDFASEATAWS